MSTPIGSVHVDVVPSTRDFVRDMRRQLLDEADNIGKEMGERIAREVADKIVRPISEGVEDGVEKARPEKGAQRSGRKAGDAFSRAFEREVRAALETLPEIDLDVETDGARRSIGELRAELREFFDEDGNLRVDVANEEGLGRIREIRTELRRLRDEDVDIPVEFDIDQAIAQLGRLERQARDHGQRAGDNFGRGLRSTLDSAMRALPDVDVGVNLDDNGAMAQLQTLYRQLEGLRDLEIGVDIREDQAVEGLRTILDQLEAISEDVEVSVRVRDDATASATALRAFLDRLFPDEQVIDYFVEFETEPAQRQVGAFATQIQREIGGAIAALPDIDLDMDSSEAEFRIAAVRRELATLSSQRIGIDVSADAAFAQLQRIRTSLEEVRELAGTRNELDIDADSAIAALRSVADSLTEVEAEGGRAHGVLNRVQEVGLLITLAFTPAAAAILGLAAAGLAVVAPIAAIAAGVQGIQAAVGPLADDLQRMRSEVSAAFVEGLTPAVGAVIQLMPTLTTGLSGVATALSSMFTQMFAAAGAAGNLEQLNRVFDQMSLSVTGLGAPLGGLIDNILEFADIGSSALVSFGPLLDEVSSAWDRVIASLQATGAGEAAVVALLQVLTSLLTLTAPLVQLGSSMFAVLGPALAAAINGTAVVIQALADAFDMLPGPIQAVLATALLLRVALALTGRTVGDLIQSVARVGGNVAGGLTAPLTAGAQSVRDFRQTLDDSGRSTSAWSTAVQSSGNRVRGSLEGMAEAMRTRIPQAAEAAGRALTGGLAGAAAAAGRAFDRLPDLASRAFEAVREAPRAALSAINNFADSTGRRLSTWGTAIDSGIRRAEQAFGRVRAAPAVALNAINSFADSTGQRLNAWGETVDNGIRRAEQAFGRVRAAPAAALGAINSFADSAGAALSRWGTAVDDGIRRGEAAFRNLPATVRGAADETVAVAGRLTQGFGEAMRQLPTVVGNAGRAVSTSVADMARSVESGLRQVPAAFRSLGTSISSGLSTIPTVISRAGQTIETGLLRIATVAEGAGRAISSGFGRAVSGLLDALGGPWGLAISAAVAALSLFGAAQAETARSSAEFKAEVQGTAEAMREAGGAITSSMREAEALRLIQQGLAAEAKTLGANLTELTNTAISGGPAWDQLRTRLEESWRAADEATKKSQAYGQALTAEQAAMVASGQSAKILLDTLGPLAEKYKQAADENRIFSELIRQSGNSMVGGIGQAAQLTEAFSTLSNEMATTADRASALYDALLLLTGGTLPAEQALASMRNALADIREAFVEARVGATEAGTTIADSAGRINQGTQAGRDLVLALTDVGQSALTAAASVFEATGGMQNVAAASTAAGSVIREQRNNFLQVAMAAGLSADAANDYANRLGLIPELVETLLRMEGVPQMQQELLQIQGLVDAAAKGAIVPINVSGEALALLEQIGVKIVELPEGKVGILVDDQTAPQIQTILAAIEASRGILPIQADGAAVPPAVDVLRGQVAGAPATMPVQADGTPVPPAVDALRGQVAGTPATMPITAVDQGASGVIGALRASVAQVANMPVTAVDAGATGLINALRLNAAQVVSIPVAAIDAGASGLINGLRTNAAQVVSIPITARDAGASGLINALRSNAAQPATMPISAADQGATGVINSLRSNAAQPVAMPITARDDGASGVINTMREAAGAVVVMPIDANDRLARGRLASLIGEISSARATITVDANTSSATDAINRLKQPTSSTHTVHIVTIGQLPRAMGGIVPAGFSLFANGGLHSGRLTPMPANYARVVQPNTFRVIGDRARDAEAYIPINQAPRSQKILKLTAAQMGWGLHPLAAMASGGVLATRRDERIATQSTRSFQASLSTPVGGTVSARGVEQRLDQIAALLEQHPRQPTSITVEDRSGDPVQTARATQLALRLARH